MLARQALPAFMSIDMTEITGIHMANAKLDQHDGVHILDP